MSTSAAESVVADYTEDGARINDAHRAALRSIARVVEESTPHTPEDQALDGVLRLLQEQGPAFVITGAGVSTDSGIPDYRGPRGSLRRHRPMTFQEFRHDPEASHRYWARSFVGWRLMNRAAPNPVHFALAELEQAGYVGGIVTQNVDGLHQQAGSRNVVSIHGDLDVVRCLVCGAAEDRHALDERLKQENPGYLESIALDPSQVNPDGDVDLDDRWIGRFRMVGCLRCGSEMLKPDVVYFGEPVPEERKWRAQQMLSECGSMLVIGSSLAVMSGLRLVLDGLREGKELGVLNGGPGRADPRASFVWRTPLRPALEMVLDEIGL